MQKTLYLVFLFFAAQLNAQIYKNTKYFELGLTAVAINYSGDLAEKQIHLAQTRMGAGVFVRYELARFFSLRGQLFTGKIFGDDKNSPTHAGRNFRSSNQVVETVALLEGNLGSLKIDAISSASSYYIAPYVFAGVGATFSKPQVTYYGPTSQIEQFVLQPIPEGGSKRRTLLATPFGAGIRMIFGDYYCLGLEGAFHPTHSDLLDGVSQNGNPEEKDWYYTAGVTFSYMLNGPWQQSKRDF